MKTLKRINNKEKKENVKYTNFPEPKSKEELLQLYLKCRLDPIYFIENFVIPGDLDKPIKLYDKQKLLIKYILNHHDVIVNSSRQVGKTTAVAAFMVWLLLFFPDYKIGIISKDRDHATDIILDVYTMLENLPPYFKPKKYERNRAHEKMLPNGSRIKAFAVPKDAPEKVARGIRVGFLYLDEVAFIPHVKEVYMSALPATLRLQKRYRDRGYPYGIVLTSTPNGMEGDGAWFYQKWMEAIQGESNFKPLVIHYSDVPDYDPAYIEVMKSKMDKDEWEQEYELKFLSAKNSFVDSNIALNLQFTNSPKTIKRLADESGEFKIEMYDDIKNDKIYLIGVDTASGAGGKSRQAFVICEYPDMKVIGVGYGKVNVMYFAKIVEDFILENFKNVDNYLLFIERNLNGEAIIDYYRDKNSPVYDRLYRTRVETKNKNNKINSLKNTKIQIGITTNSKTRPLMFDALYTYLTENLNNLQHLLLPEPLRSEILGLRYNGKRVEASPGLNDDLVMAFNLILYAKYYDTKSFRSQLAGVELETNKEDEVLDILALNEFRYRY